MSRSCRTGLLWYAWSRWKARNWLQYYKYWLPGEVDLKNSLAISYGARMGRMDEETTVPSNFMTSLESDDARSDIGFECS